MSRLLPVKKLLRPKGRAFLGTAGAPPVGETFVSVTIDAGSEQIITIKDDNGVEQRLTLKAG
jgi:hypothetical protein